MKKYKIFILAIISLILAFSCFTGFVSAPSAMAQPYDTLFPPQSSDYIYLYLDFTSCGIPTELINQINLFICFNAYNSNFSDMRFDTFIRHSLIEAASTNLVYQFALPKALVLSFDMTNLYFCFVYAADTSYGTPLIGAVTFFDNEEVSFIPTHSRGSNYIFISILPSDLSSVVITFDNPYSTLRTQYNDLDIAYRNQQLQLISETSRANQAEANYNNLLSQYNELNSTYEDLQLDYNSLSVDYYDLRNQYTSLQSDYEDLESQNVLLQSDLQDALALADSFQRELREVIAQNERLQELVNNLPPTDLAFGWVGTAFATLDSILSIEIIPNISIGSLVLIPLILGVLFFVLRLVRGE